MKEIVEITNNPKQMFSFQLDNGGLITIRLYYIESQIGWFFDLEYDGIVSNCHRLTNSPNIIREARNIFPFGIACSVSDGQEPYFLDDFVNGRVQFYVLDKDDVEYIEETVYGKIF